MHTIASIGLVALAAQAANAAYVWPSKWDDQEDLLAMQDGYLRFGFTDQVIPCGFGANREGTNTAAEWIRTAFHDTITHDKSKGLGGLDGSIRFETNRPENPGSAFNTTLGQLSEFVTPVTSGADLIAMGFVAAVASCGGNKVPHRPGRVDATEANEAGVPEPSTDLNTTMNQFTKAGFSTSDMIAMIACGHSVGQVHSVDFPELVNGTASEANVATFDESGARFDTAVVDEYLDSDGVNPLVFSSNDTMNSDKRAFGADGNVTMKALRDPTTFQNTCQDVFDRMLQTVPGSVTLDEPIEFVDVKPYINAYEFNANQSAFSFGGRVRVRTSDSTGLNADDLSIALILSNTKNQTTTVSADRARFKAGQSSGFFREVFTWFEFQTELPLDSPATSFTIQLKNSNGTTTTFDNGGTGSYPLETDLLYLQGTSCMNLTAVSGNYSMQVRVAAKSSISQDDIIVPIAHRVNPGGIAAPLLQIENAPTVSKDVTVGDYQLYTFTAPIETAGWSSTLSPQLRSRADAYWPWRKTTILADHSC